MSNDERWWHGWNTCNICGNVQMSVIEIETDQEEPGVPMECGECGNFACYPSDGPEEESQDEE